MDAQLLFKVMAWLLPSSSVGSMQEESLLFDFFSFLFFCGCILVDLVEPSVDSYAKFVNLDAAILVDSELLFGYFDPISVVLDTVAVFVV